MSHNRCCLFMYFPFFLFAKERTKERRPNSTAPQKFGIAQRCLRGGTLLNMFGPCPRDCGHSGALKAREYILTSTVLYARDSTPVASKNFYPLIAGGTSVAVCILHRSQSCKSLEGISRNRCCLSYIFRSFFSQKKEPKKGVRT